MLSFLKINKFLILFIVISIILFTIVQGFLYSYRYYFIEYEINCYYKGSYLRYCCKPTSNNIFSENDLYLYNNYISKSSTLINEYIHNNKKTNAFPPQIIDATIYERPYCGNEAIIIDIICSNFDLKCDTICIHDVFNNKFIEINGGFSMDTDPIKNLPEAIKDFLLYSGFVENYGRIITFRRVLILKEKTRTYDSYYEDDSIIFHRTSVCPEFFDCFNSKGKYTVCLKGENVETPIITCKFIDKKYVHGYGLHGSKYFNGKSN